MGKDTRIPYVHHSWNPWMGCTNRERFQHRGCNFCFMHRDQKRYGRNPTEVVRTGGKTFNAPNHWAPGRALTCSWSDWNLPQADPWRSDAWEVIRRNKHILFMILTKMPERILQNLPADWGDGYENVRLGITIWDQESADRMIPQFVGIPARGKFLSVEPLVAPLWLQTPGASTVKVGGRESSFSYLVAYPGTAGAQRWIDWVLIGGESGLREQAVAPLHPAWVRSLVQQCSWVQTDVFFKAWGEYAPVTNLPIERVRGRELLTVTTRLKDDGPVLTEQMVRAGHDFTGDVLDGKQYHQAPALFQIAGEGVYAVA